MTLNKIVKYDILKLFTDVSSAYRPLALSCIQEISLYNIHNDMKYFHLFYFIFYI